MRDDESTPCTGCRPEWKQRLRVKTALTSFFFVSFLFFAATNVACGQEVQGAQSLEDITVTANKVTLSPNKTEVFIKDYTIAGAPTTVFDILKDRAMIDFRGQSDLVPEPDTFQMRGFETRQFITAVDGLPIQKPADGGETTIWIMPWSPFPLLKASSFSTAPILPCMTGKVLAA